MNPLASSSLRRALVAALAVTAIAWSGGAQAHCDTLDGPVVSQARTALDTANVNLVLGWVRQADEAEIRRSFEQAVAVRRAGGASRELADRYFFETLVRVHRAGEGAPYTGLQPAGQVEPSVAAADTALRTAQLAPVARMLAQQTEHGLHQRFEAALASKPRDAADVQAARAHVAAYVDYVHYVEGLSLAAQGGAGHAAAEGAATAAHEH
jgi:hypothetical protein